MHRAEQQTKCHAQKFGTEAEPSHRPQHKQTVVIAHGPCNDGRIAAWCHWRTQPAVTKARLAEEGGVYAIQSSGLADGDGPKPFDGGQNNLVVRRRTTAVENAERLLAEGCDTVYVFAQPLDRIPVSLVSGRHLLLLDITLEASLRQLVEESETTEVCDHHESARGLLEKLTAEYPSKLSVSFDTKRSGARIAWERYFPGQPLPPVVAYVEDRDLWQWRLPASREVNEALQVEDRLATFGDIERLHAEWTPNADVFADLCTRGALYMRSQRAYLNRLAKGAIRATVAVRWPEKTSDQNNTAARVGCCPSSAVPAMPFKTYNVLLCCSPTHASELAHVLLEEHAPLHEQKGWEIHFVAVWQPNVLPRRQIYVSVRTSRPDIDLSVLSTRVVGGAGGGGHIAAAGFRIDGADVTSVFRPVATGPFEQTTQSQPTADTTKDKMARLEVRAVGGRKKD